MIAVIAITCHGNTEIFFRMKGHTYLKEFSIAISDISNLVVSVIDAVQNAGFDDSPQLAMEAKSEEEAAFFVLLLILFCNRTTLMYVFSWRLY